MLNTLPRCCLWLRDPTWRERGEGGSLLALLVLPVALPRHGCRAPLKVLRLLHGEHFDVLRRRDLIDVDPEDLRLGLVRKAGTSL